MSSVSIIGSGNMASAIGALAVKGGNAVEVMGRDAANAAALASALGNGATAGTQFEGLSLDKIVEKPQRQQSSFVIIEVVRDRGGGSSGGTARSIVPSVRLGLAGRG